VHPEYRFESFDAQYEILGRIESAITGVGWPKLERYIEAAFDDGDYWDRWRVEVAVPDKPFRVEEASLGLRQHISRRLVSSPRYGLKRRLSRAAPCKSQVTSYSIPSIRCDRFGALIAVCREILQVGWLAFRNVERR
jgi:hypothetical protein